jgi:hypothetical protein
MYLSQSKHVISIYSLAHFNSGFTRRLVTLYATLKKFTSVEEIQLLDYVLWLTILEANGQIPIANFVISFTIAFAYLVGETVAHVVPAKEDGLSKRTL